MTPESKRRKQATPEVYDFRRPLTLAREHARVLEMAYETFARQWGTQLTARARVHAQVTLTSVQMTSYDEYIRQLSDNTAMILCNVEASSRQNAILQMPIETGLTWLDFMCGGTGIIGTVREYTEIETQLLQDLLHIILGDLGYAFTAIMPVTVAVKSIQYNPQFVQAVPASDAVIVATFQATIGERTDNATLMMPADFLTAALRQADSADNRSPDEQVAREKALADLEAAVSHTPMDVAVRYTPRVVQPREVIGLAVGDTLPLTHLTSRPLEVVIGDAVIARASTGNSGSRLACMVTSIEENTP